MNYRLRHVQLSEADVVKACRDLLHVRGWTEHRMVVGPYWRFGGGRHFGPFQGEPAGTPDYICAHPRFPAFYWEAKRPKPSKFAKTKGLSPIQQFRIREIEQGRRLAVCVAEHPSKLREWLDLHEKGKGELS